MPRKQVVRRGAADGLLSGSALEAADPSLARALLKAVTESNAETTRRGYQSATNKYVKFCELRKLDPWPVQEEVLGAWIVRLMTTVKPSSLRVYLAAVKGENQLLGFQWSMQNSFIVQRVLKYVKRTLPTGGKGEKFAVTLDVLVTILPLLPRWPDLTTLAYDDLVFALASICAVLGFLRGGEFTYKKGQSRPPLRMCDIARHEEQGLRGLVMNIRQAKSTWWLSSGYVPIFGPSDGLMPEFSPLVLWDSYVSRSAHAKAPTAFAFHHEDGSPVSRDFMVSKTAELLRRANISLIDDRGVRTPVKAASWRSGGLRSSLKAKVREPVFKAQGRWASNAWENYMVVNKGDVRAAAAEMWKCAEPVMASRRLRVESLCTMDEVDGRMVEAAFRKSAAAEANLMAIRAALAAGCAAPSHAP